MDTKDNHIGTFQDSLPQDYKSLYDDTCAIIEDSRQRAYHVVNISLTLRNWLLGERIARDELDGADRAEYGKHIIATLAHDLTSKYGGGLDRKSLYNYLKFYRCFPEIVDSLQRQSPIVDSLRRQS